MTYLDVANMTKSTSLTMRMSAAAAVEHEGGAVLDPPEPETWAYAHRWEIVAAPGWADAWASAEANGNPDPGADEGVITDGMILSQVQAVLAG